MIRRPTPEITANRADDKVHIMYVANLVDAQARLANLEENAKTLRHQKEVIDLQLELIEAEVAALGPVVRKEK